MEINISDLRKEGRPLWMSNLDVESFAEIAGGGGGDIYMDRYAAEWGRSEGLDVDAEE